MTTPAVQVDTVTAQGSGFNGMGTVAQRLLASNFDVNALRLNADINAQGVLRKDEWVQFDNAIIPVARQRLVAIGDLMERGLSTPIPNALGTTRVEWERMSDMDPALISMSGTTQGGNDRVVFDLQGIPLPIVHRDFQINIRALEASRKSGQALDTQQAQLAARLVSEKVESIYFTGAVVGSSTNVIHGITNHPNRVTGTVTAPWLTATGDQIINDINAMIGAAIVKNMFGPYILYVPLLVNNKLDTDLKAAIADTIRERIMKIPTILKIIASPNLTASQVVLLQATSDVVDILDGIQPTTVMWESNGGFTVNFKVMAIIVPRLKVDFKNQMGLVHYS